MLPIMVRSSVDGIPSGLIPEVFPPPFDAVFGAAYSALTLPATSIGVSFVVWVSFGAMCLSSTLGRRAVAAQSIHADSNSIKVFWINASPVVAEMVNSEARRYRAAKVFVRESVSIPHPIVDPKNPITILFKCPSPQPAVLRLINKCKKAIMRCPLLVKSLSGNILAAASVVYNHALQLYIISPPTMGAENRDGWRAV